MNSTMFESSTLFELQIDELLKNSLNERNFINDKLRKWLRNFKKYLEDLSFPCSSPVDEEVLGNLVKTPIFQSPESSKKISFNSPSNVIEIGSFNIGTLCDATPIIDIAVEIPKKCWMKMDFLNQHYHRKRALYLSCIASSLLQADFVGDLKFKYQDECYLKPVLMIFPKGFEKTAVCLTAYPAADAFELRKFAPSRNNVRSSWFFKDNEDDNLSTPYYTATMLSDILLPSLNEYLETTISSQSIKDGLKLLKLWCLQRGLIGGYGRLNGFILSMYVAYLLQKKKITSIMNACQIFRITLLCFQNENWLEQGITLSEKDTLESFRPHYDVLFLDSSGSLNLCYCVNKETIQRMQHEAKIALSILENNSPEGFMHLFINKVTFSKKFEYILHLKSKNFKKYVKTLGLERKLLNFGENVVACLLPKICEVLRIGLNSRVSLLDITRTPHAPWPLHELPPTCCTGHVSIGFLLDPDVPLTSVEKGPAADDPMSKEFRKFWGERSELRRFQDGTIREAVYWPATTIADKRKVFILMITDILKRHLNAKDKDIAVTGIEGDCILEVPKHSLSAGFAPYGTGEEAHATLMQSFNNLCKQLRSLNGLPLLIASIQGASASFRFTEVFPPLSVMHKIDPSSSYLDGHLMKLNDGTGCPPYTPALKAILTLEGSGKWPDDVNAIKRVKAAFHLKIAERVLAETSSMATAYPTHTDIFKDGYVFRVEVACHKEIFLLKQVRTPNGSLKIQENKESRELEIATEIIPKLTSVLHGLQKQFSSFGTACRLAKRWISAQLKQGFLHDIAIELLVAKLYLHPEPYSCPCTPQVAFVRFLSLVVNHDWATAPLIVNFNNELTNSDIEEIRTTFSSQRSTLPAMTIVTPLDRRGNLWTKHMPVPLILKRISYLAEASLQILDNILNRVQVCNIKAIFRPPLDSYDVIIYLDRSNIPRLCNAVDVYTTDVLPVHVPYQYNSNEVYPVVDFDPTQMYLDELKENFGEFAFFLYDAYGGDFIAVMWKRSSFNAKEFTVSHVNCRTLNSNGTQVVPDVERIIEDFEVLGSGLVKKIVKQTENWHIP